MRRLVTTATATLALAGAAVAGTADAASASGLSSSKFCGTAAYMGVHVSSHTSCQFAKAITRKHLKSGAHRVSAYSAAADRTITMRCHMVWTSDSPYTTCSGGNQARLWITS